MQKRQCVSEQIFIERFKIFFERLHHVVTGSRKIAQLDNVAIYEKELMPREKINFYFFCGKVEEQKKFFPGENEAYCTFRNSSSTITASFGNKSHDFVCNFGYILHSEELLAEFRLSERSERAVQWASVQICSHEIRHEMQLQNSAEINELNLFPSIPVHPKGKIDWNDIKEKLELLYQGYVDKNHDAEYLAREYDAVAISLVCLTKWFKGGNFKTRIHKLAEIIKK